MAKHLARDGVWGVTPFAFSASVTSPGWSVALAAIFRVVGPSSVAPVALNVLLGTVLLLLADAIMRGQGVSGILRVVALLVIGLSIPLPALVVLGMEHVLQAVVTLGLVWCAARNLASDPHASPWLLGSLAAAATMTRYDAAIAVAVVAGACAFAHRVRLAAAVAVSGAAPLIVMAALAWSRGWPALPAPVLIRMPLLSEPRTPTRAVLRVLGYRAVRTLVDEPALAVLLSALVVVLMVHWIRDRRARDERVWLLAISAGLILAHANFDAVGWLFRYEAYLFAVALTALAAAGLTLVKPVVWSAWRTIPIVIVSVAAAWPALRRGFDASLLVPAASAEQFQTRHQLALFVRRFYDGRTIALGDIGEICYTADVRLIDLNGLGSRDLLPTIRATPGRRAPAEAQRLAAARADLAIAEWGTDALDGWTRVGCWSPDRPDATCLEAEIGFYAPEGAPAAELAGHLARFELPRGPGALTLHLTR